MSLVGPPPPFYVGIWFAFGDLTLHPDTISYVRHQSPDTKVLYQINSVKDALNALDLVDVLVAQTFEAGGHFNPDADTCMVFVPMLAKKIHERCSKLKKAVIPVIAAGGIATGEQLAGTLGDTLFVEGSKLMGHFCQ